MRACTITVLVGCLLSATVARALQYTVTDLGALPVGTSSDYGEALNNGGDVAGYVTSPGLISEAILWTAGGGYDLLGTLGGAISYAFAVNDGNVVVGRSEVGAGTQTRPFRNPPGGAMESLGTLGGDFGTAYDINNSGVITGVSSNGSVGRAFIWEEGVGISEIGNFTMAGASTGYGINSAGHVAGVGTTAAGNMHAFFWDGMSFTDLETIAMGESSVAMAINDSDTVVGLGALDEFGSTYGAFIWTSMGGIVKLDELFAYDTRAMDINNDGDVVGWSWIDGAGNSRAVLWEDGGSIVNLNDRIDPMSGWLLMNATGINNAGQIVGVGEIDDQSRAFLLTPVPEPSSFGLLVGMVCCWSMIAARLKPLVIQIIPAA